MGRDKALLGDPPWAYRVAGALEAAGCDPVILLGGDPALAHDRWTQHGDEHPGAGPGAALIHAAKICAGGICAGQTQAGTNSRETSSEPGPMVVAACDLPSLHHRDVTDLLDVVRSGASAAAYRLRGRAQWSLVAMSPGLVSNLAAADSDPGIPLAVLLEPVTRLCDPSDDSRVTDFDRPEQRPDDDAGPERSHRRS